MFEYKNKFVQEDLSRIIRTPISWEKLDNTSCLITGANGMIATYMIYLFMYLVKEKGINVHVVALSRTKSKSEELFREFLNDSHFELKVQDVCDTIQYSGKLDYIFHFAGNASPYYIKNDPVGIMKSNLIGTFNILELAKNNHTEKVMFASTREVYGENSDAHSLTETSFGKLDCLDSRSCYPESKRAAETFCKSYFLQYGINFNIIRIAHSYGPGMKLDNDGRVMSDLLNYIVKGNDIVLKSKGDALRAFCYVTDVILGLMYILFYGKKSTAYNLSNETEEIKIRSLAKMLIELSPIKGLQIRYDIVENQSDIYCNYKRIGLDTSELELLGWKPIVSLEEGIKHILKIV